MRWILCLSVCACALSGQEVAKAPATNPSPVIKAGAQEVLLDVVVRDKKGKPIRDLEAKDFDVSDEGARQKIVGFRLVTGNDAAGLGSETATGPKALDPLRQLRLVSLVYERLDNDARRLARQASMEFLKNELEQNVYLAVFVIDQRLHVLQQFTNDRDLLRKAIELGTTTQYTQFAAQSDAIRQQLEKAVQAEESTQAAAAATSPVGGQQAGAAGTAHGAAAAAAKMAEVTLHMLQFEESLSRVQQSRSSIFSLLSLVREQAPLPGRKTLIYFSEGLQVPESMIETFNSVIGAANRAGVSVYGVDARGLLLEQQNAQAKAMLDSAVKSSRTQQTTQGGNPVTPDQAKIFDTARDSIHGNVQESLDTLSTNTGGFLIANTNDFRMPFRKVSEDIHAYYEVSYVPQIAEYDGKFRKIAVKVDRPDVKVQTRSGYFALPPNEGTVFAYEMPLLNALNSNPLPNNIPYHAAALRFRKEDNKVEYGLVIEVPMKDVTFTEDPANHRYRAHLSLLALFKDQKGEVAEHFSRDLPLEAPADKLEALRRGNFIQTYHVNLAPGRYVLDSAVIDRENMKISAHRAAVVVLPPPAGISLSSLALIRRVEPQSGETDAEDPFHFEGGRVVPTLDNSIQASASGELSYYFVVYPLNSGADKPELKMEFIKDGTPIGQASPQLPPPGKNGLIPYVAEMPLANFSPGNYELITTVKQGSSVAEQRTSFSIHP
ncbi:MAG TPA: VWA domain-containing protein [Bryobacteraceae bacterium]|nr:VWA domain-containing protein [Bryobacteraceae bacterium]